MGFQAILIGIFITFILILLLDYLQLRKLNKVIVKYPISGQLNSDKYYELKWRINTIITTVIIATGILSYIGYNLNENVQNKYKEIEQIDERIKLADERIQQADDKIALLDSLSKDVDRKYSKNISKIQNDINTVQNENLRRSQVYVVTEIPIPVEKVEDDNRTKIYFNDLVTNTDSKLPRFTKAPIVQPITNHNDGNVIQILEVSNEYFIYSISIIEIPVSGILGEQKQFTGKFDIWISNQ